MTIALYNEIEPFAADTLENLIDAGLIAPGIVDRRSIEDLTPEYLSHFTQVHFFAGIGVWSHALRQAGISDDTPLWTGSCPCQPFSSAGKGDGFDDERHLWPAWFWLIEQCRPERLFGEQVASKDANPWVALVQADLEGLGYSFGAVPFTAAGVGAPNIRERLYWVADSGSAGPLSGTHPGVHSGQDGTGSRNGEPERSCAVGGLADPNEPRLEGRVRSSGGPDEQLTRSGSMESGMANPYSQQHPHGQPRSGNSNDAPGWNESTAEVAGLRSDSGSSTNNGFWDASDWLFCRDGRWRPVEPGTFPLAHGLARGMGSLDARLRELASVAELDAASLRDAKSYRVGALKAYGNAINAVAATEFIRACLTN